MQNKKKSSRSQRERAGEPASTHMSAKAKHQQHATLLRMPTLGSLSEGKRPTRCHTDEGAHDAEVCS